MLVIRSGHVLVYKLNALIIPDFTFFTLHVLKLAI